MKYRVFILLIILLFNKTIHAQNLVPNTSFESNSGCPNQFSSAQEDIVKLDNWKNVKTSSANQYSSTDYYSSECLTGYLTDINDGASFRGPFSYPPNNTGNTGNRFVGSYFRSMSPDAVLDYREGITTQLNESLIVGVQYKVEFYICAAFDRSIDRIGVYFSNSKLTTSVTSVTPQLETPAGQYFTKVQGWVKISFDYTPTVSGQQHILITNFRTDAQTNSIGNQNYSSYYFIDDVSVKITCCEPNKIYQNTINMPKTTTTYDYISAGSNILPTNIGPVRVQSGKTVKYKAANRINLEPGFSVDAGGIFSANIEPCDENAQNDIDVAIPTAYLHHCSPLSYFNIFIYPGTEAYKFLLYNSWGNLVFTSEGAVNSITNSVWNGYCYPSGTQSNCIAEQSHVYIIYAYSCNGKQTYTGIITFLGYENCIVGGEEESSNKLASDKIIPIFKSNLNYTVFPNPSHTDSKLQLNVEQDNQKVSAVLYDMKGSMLKTILPSTIFNVGTYTIDIPRDDLPVGEYILSIKMNDVMHSEKIIFN